MIKYKKEILHKELKPIERQALRLFTLANQAMPYNANTNALTLSHAVDIVCKKTLTAEEYIEIAFNVMDAYTSIFGYEDKGVQND